MIVVRKWQVFLPLVPFTVLSHGMFDVFWHAVVLNSLFCPMVGFCVLSSLFYLMVCSCVFLVDCYLVVVRRLVYPYDPLSYTGGRQLLAGPTIMGRSGGKWSDKAQSSHIS